MGITLPFKTGAFLDATRQGRAAMSTYEVCEQPYGHYCRVLYPEWANPDSTRHWLGKWKTLEMCMGLFGARQRALH